jgi:lysophospholipase L1-like esterase
MSFLNRSCATLSLAALACVALACEPEVEPTPPNTPPPAGGSTRPPCLRSSTQVVALGDSYMSLPMMLVPRIEALASAAGALSFGQNYRDYSAPGTTLGSPTFPGDIPPQWDYALADNRDITTIIMDGGGNDIIASLGSILAGCLDPGAAQNPACTSIIQDCMNVVRQLATRAKSAGVDDVIYFLYPHVPIGGDDILDYSVQEAKKMTAELTTPTFRVHLIDTRAAFEGHPEYFDLDPVHANDAGAEVIANLIWQKMKSQCIAQPASSGCCQP